MKRIGIFGPPRSGTSWVSQVFNSHPMVAMRFQPLFSYTHRGALTSSSSRLEIDNFFRSIFLTDDEFVLMRSAFHRSYPAFEKSARPSHLFFKETRYLDIVRNILEATDDVITIGVIRSPLATLSSWVAAPKEFEVSWDISFEWRYAPSKNEGRAEEFYGFDKWKQVALEFLDLERCYPMRFKLARYDEIIVDPVLCFSSLFEFCGLSMSRQSIEFIHDSACRYDDDPYSVFRGRGDQERWRATLPSYIQDSVIKELTGTPLEVFIDR